jgi:hypothetical protein
MSGWQLAADGAPVGRRAAHRADGWAGIRDGGVIVFLNLDVELAACRGLFKVGFVRVSFADVGSRQAANGRAPSRGAHGVNISPASPVSGIELNVGSGSKLVCSFRL